MRLRLKTGAGAWTIQPEKDGVKTGVAADSVLKQRFPSTGVSQLNPNHRVDASL